MLLVAGPLTFAAWWAAIAWILGDAASYLRGTPSFFAGQDAPFGFLGLLSSRSIVILPQVALGLGMPLVGLALLVRRSRIHEARLMPLDSSSRRLAAWIPRTGTPSSVSSSRRSSTRAPFGITSRRRDQGFGGQGFAAWFTQESSKMDHDLLIRYFRDERIFILKERRLTPIRRHVAVALAEAVINPRGLLTTKVIRAKP